VQWVALVVCCVVVALSLVFTPYRFALASLIVLVTIVVAFYNATYVATARMLGLREIEEFGVGFSPVLAQFRIGQAQFRLGAFMVGGYVKFPAQRDDGRPSGFMLLHPIRQATIALSGPVLCALAGWALCEVGGADGIIGHIAQWFRSEDLRQWQCWRLAVRTLLTDMSSISDLPRAAGSVMLAFGLLNLIPVPVLSGGLAARILGEYAVGRKTGEKVWAGLAYVGLLPLLAVFCIAFVTFLTVLFKGQ
jgi:membrane-associated protease RseP (regulator of RpoE activity)